MDSRLEEVAVTSEVERIGSQLRNAVERGGWHGPPLLRIMRNLTAAEAASRPLRGAHSAWEIALHLVAWLETVDRRLRGEHLELGDAEAWPEVEQGLDESEEAAQTAWSELVDRASAAHERLQGTLARMADADLQRPVPGRDHDMYFMLHGVIQHTLYHAGQIAILTVGERSPASGS